MLNRTTLDPETRVLYGDSLQPPPGYVFDAAIATTYSLDFDTALAVPVNLALFASDNREEVLSHPLALLEAAERIAGRLVVYADAGNLSGHHAPHSRLCSLMERIIVEVAAPGGGAFHPKIWALRYKPKRSEDPIALRLLILSRNLTRDRSWDVSLRLDGELGRRTTGKNLPLFNLLSRLPDLAVAGVSEESRNLTIEVAEDFRRAKWYLPKDFHDVTFAVNGFSKNVWRPQSCSRMGIISPFCDTRSLDMLAGLPTLQKPRIISRSDQLACIDVNTLEGFEDISVLDEMATSDDEEDVETSTTTAINGLHAKIFINEIGWDTFLTVGSGNATAPSLLNGKNVEFFATLQGKRSKVGGVEQIMGKNGFGRLTRKFVPEELNPIDLKVRSAEALLDEARRALCRGGLRLRCERHDSENDDASLWRVWLIPNEPLNLTGITSLKLWPITRGDGHSRDALDALRSGDAVDLGEMAILDLTRFIAFQISAEDNLANALFSSGLIIEGLPSERQSAILMWVINSKDAFFNYLRLLLAEFGDNWGPAYEVQRGSARNTWGIDFLMDETLLESLVRALSNGSERLFAIERLIKRLEFIGNNGADPIPPEFRTLWEAFRGVIQDQEVHPHE